MHATIRPVLAAMSLLFFAGYAAAQTNLGQIQVGEVPTEGSGIYTNVANDSIVSFIASLNHSYCCSVRADSAEAKIASAMSEGVGGVTLTARGMDSPVLATSIAYQNARVCFEATSTLFSTATFNPIDLVLAFSSSPASKVWVQCEDTTLVGGFNTMSSNYNFLELLVSGVPSGDILGTVRLLSYSGTGVVVPFGLDAIRRDVSVHDRFSTPTFGRVTVTHTGAPGSVLGSLAEYRIDDSDPTSFTLVGRGDLKPLK